MRDNIERWLTHEGLSFEEIKNPENSFQILVKHAGKYGIPAEIFEPKAQSGILVIGTKVIMKNNQIARYLGFNEDEKERFKEKVNDYCNSIQAINKIITEDGKQKVGVWNVPQIEHALENREPAPDRQRAEFPLRWLLWRRDFKTYWRSLEVHEAWALEQALNGANFAEICEGLLEWIDAEQVALTAAGFLKQWISDQLLTRLGDY